MYDNFTDAAKQVMVRAEEEVKRFNHTYIGTEHILLALISGETDPACMILRKMNLDRARIRLEIMKLVRRAPNDVVTTGRIPLTPRAKRLVEYAVEEAGHLESKFVGTPHLLLGIMREHDGVAAQVLMNLNMKLEEVRAVVRARFPKMDDATNESVSEVPESEASTATASDPNPSIGPYGYQRREAMERLAGLLNRKWVPASPQEELQIAQIHATLAAGAALHDLNNTLREFMSELSKG